MYIKKEIFITDTLISEWELSQSLIKLGRITTCVVSGQTPYSRLFHWSAEADISLSRAHPLSLHLEIKI